MIHSNDVVCIDNFVPLGVGMPCFNINSENILTLKILNNQTCTTTTTVSTPFTVNLTPYDPQYSIGNALE